MRLLAALIGFIAMLGTAHADVPPDWVDVKAGPMFTVKAPPGTMFERIRTGDAFAGTFHAPGFDIAVEFGYHRDGLPKPADAKNLKTSDFVTDGKPATFTTAEVGTAGPPLFAGLYVADVETDPLGPLSLVMTARVTRSEDAATLRAISETVVFGFKN